MSDIFVLCMSVFFMDIIYFGVWMLKCVMFIFYVIVCLMVLVMIYLFVFVGMDIYVVYIMMIWIGWLLIGVGLLFVVGIYYFIVL